MRDNLTHAIEDYLKTIYDITTCCDRASTNQIAEALGVAPASVTGMIKKLASTQPPLVEYERHHGVVLTPTGEQIALEILRHHRLLEMYLYQILGYEWDEVHDEAERLEHVISEELEQRIAQALGDPSHDPHGDPIPTQDLRMPDSPSLLLADLRPGQSAVIHRVVNTDPQLLRYLSGLGLKPQTHIIVLQYSPFDENISLEIPGQGKNIVLGPVITRQIFVELSD
jgi:DtxR family Mn-dependent transcriptional regulator